MGTLTQLVPVLQTKAFICKAPKEVIPILVLSKDFFTNDTNARIADTPKYALPRLPHQNKQYKSRS